MRSHEGSGKALEERFWEKVDRGESDECWEWKAATDTGGYGRIHVDGHDEGAHRVSMGLEYGEMPGDNWVLHHCDNPSCVNPNHLYLGDRSDNQRDMYERGQRSGTGEDNPPAKLTEEEVAEIRERAKEGESQYDIADDFSINQSTVTNILAGRIWAHSLPDDWEWDPEPKRGEDNPNAKLTREGADEIRERASGGETQASIADDFGVSTATVSMIVRGKRWANEEDNHE